MCGCAHRGMKLSALQRPLANEVIRIVMRGEEKEDNAAEALLRTS
jgi:hypothetical protein